MSARVVVLSLGSNIEPRLVHLRAGLSAISRLVRLARVSSVWLTEPLDSTPDSAPYLNLIALGTTSSEPEALLLALQRAESDRGTRRPVRNSPRRLDIDIVWMDGVIRRTQDPLLPHPRFRERAFVLAPMQEIRFDRFDSVTGRRISAMQGRGAVEKFSSVW